MCQMQKSEEPPLSHLVTNRRLRLFGHIAHSSLHRPTGSDQQEDLATSHTWVRAIEADLGPLNFGLATAWRKATTRNEWRHYCGHSNAPAEYALKERRRRSQTEPLDKSYMTYYWSSYLTLNIIVTLKCGLEVTQGH